MPADASKLTDWIQGLVLKHAPALRRQVGPQAGSPHQNKMVRDLCAHQHGGYGFPGKELWGLAGRRSAEGEYCR